MLNSNKWFIFAVVICFYFLSYFYRVSTAVITPDLVREFNIGPDRLGLLSSIYFYTFALAQIPLGPSLDRVGARIMGFFLGMLAAAGATIFALAPTFPLAVCGRGLIGLGVSVAYMGALKIVAHWFLLDEFAMMSALAMAIGNVGALTATVPLALLSGWIGWRLTFICLSVITMFSAVAILLFVKDYPSHRSIDIAGSALFAPALDRITVKKSFSALIKEKNFWLIAWMEFFWFGSFIGIQGLWGGPYLMDVYGLSPPKAGSILAMIAVGFIFGGPFLGKLSDRVLRSRKWVILVGLGIYVLLILTLAALEQVSNITLLYALFFFFGFVGSSGIIGYAHAKELFPLSMSGTVMTCLNFFTVSGAAILQHIMGHIIKSYPHIGKAYPFAAYRAAFGFCLLGMFISLIFYSFSAEQVKDQPLSGKS